MINMPTRLVGPDPAREVLTIVTISTRVIRSNKPVAIERPEVSDNAGIAIGFGRAASCRPKLPAVRTVSKRAVECTGGHSSGAHEISEVIDQDPILAPGGALRRKQTRPDPIHDGVPGDEAVTCGFTGGERESTSFAT